MKRWHWPWCVYGRMYGDALNNALDRLGRPACLCNSIPEMPFIRLAWLLDDEVNLYNLPRMQDLPREAFIYAPEMREAYFISHRWLARDHPDISGQQIAIALSHIGCDYDDSTRKPSTYAHTNSIGLWYDFLCLPQAPRTRDEQRVFDKLLTQLGPLVLTTLPILVMNEGKEYATRAWCMLEGIGAQLSGKGTLLSLGSQALKFENVLCGGENAWDISGEFKIFRAGVAKLQSWAEQMGLTIECDAESAMKIDLDARTSFALASLELSGAISLLGFVTYEKLFALARRYNLQCTYQDDLKLCMRLIYEVVKSGGNPHYYASWE